jgi:uncharacterized integral membrane protein (TIGR00698 family)
VQLAAFFGLSVVVFAFRMTPAMALAAGLVMALTIGTPFRALVGRWSSRVLQWSVVGLGFGIGARDLLHSGTNGVVFTAALIVSVLAIGLALARTLAVSRPVAILITVGTSICGGSAIAAMGPAIGAKREEMSVSLATVFLLNAIGLYVFPPLGHLVGLTEHQFGLWAALAIHDTSSVVGAAATYGPSALKVATVLKLARALWIIPLVIAVPWWLHRRGAAGGSARPVPKPWFIALFVCASLARSAMPESALPTFDLLTQGARMGLVYALFLIGSLITRDQVKAIGPRPLVLAVALWIVVAAGSLAAITLGVPV